MNPKESAITAKDLAHRIGGTLEGDPHVRIEEAAPIDRAGPRAITWVGKPHLLKKALASQAGVLLVHRDCPASPGRTLIRVSDPDAAMIDVLEALAPPQDQVPPGVHLSAVIADDARIEGAAIGPFVTVGTGTRIGPGTQIHPGARIGSRVTIGRDCIIWPNVVIREGVSIGDRVIIHPNATIGADGFGFLFRNGEHRKIPQIGTVIIEDDVEIGANSTVDRAKTGATRIGRGTKIDNLCIIAHNCDIGEHCVMAAHSGTAGSTTLGHHSAFGGRVSAIDHLNIGSGVQVAAMSGIFNDIPDGTYVRGLPAIENQKFLRELASLRKLPELLRQLRRQARQQDERA